MKNTLLVIVAILLSGCSLCPKKESKVVAPGMFNESDYKGLFQSMEKIRDTSVLYHKPSMKSVAGEYGIKNQLQVLWSPQPDPEKRQTRIVTSRLVFLENGLYKSYFDDRKTHELKWKIVDVEIYVYGPNVSSGVTVMVFRINKDGSITEIAHIVDGKRTGYSKERGTYKRIQTAPTKTKAQIKAAEKAFVETKAKAEQGDGDAQVRLGAMYRLGQGVEKDFKEAVKWYRKAAEQDVAQAQYNLGVMYANGKGVKQDDKEAVKCYRKAAEQGDEYAKAALKKRLERQKPK